MMSDTGVVFRSWTIVGLLVVHFLLSETAPARDSTSRSAALDGSNFRIYPSAITQTETFIVRHPSDPDMLFISANTIDLSTGFISEGIYVTMDGGSTWSGSDTCNGAPIGFHRGDPGIAIDSYGTFILIRLGFSPGLYSHYSTNMGMTWSSQKTVATNDQDRATIASDTEALSPHRGRTYAAWVRFSPPYPVMVAMTDDGARTWTTPQQINQPTMRGFGGEVAVNRDGVVYLCWAGVGSTSPFTEDIAGFASSTDGGVTWIVREPAFDMNGISGTLPEKTNIRVNGLPRMDLDRNGGDRDGWIYIVTTEKNLTPAGTDPDIILHRSSNGGAQWSEGIRVNQDPLNNGKIQYFPVIHVDASGGINVLFYDDRATTADSAGVWLARSTDGGTSWSEHTISDHQFKPLPIGGLGQGYQGDNIALTSIGTTLWPVWMDNSSGIYQLWTCPVDITLLDVAGDTEHIPYGFTLHQNYPNPFNPHTTIRYELRQGSTIRLSVYDVIGRMHHSLSEDWREAGVYALPLDADVLQLPSGTYFYRMETDDGSITKRMVLIR